MPELSERMAHLGTETAFEVLARAEELARGGRDIINSGSGSPTSRRRPTSSRRRSRPFATATTATPRPRHSRASRGGRGGHRGPPRGGGGPGAHRRRAGRQGHDVLRDPHVRGARHGDHVPQPGFPIYESVIEYSGAKAVPIPLLESQDFSFDAEAVLASITPATASSSSTPPPIRPAGSPESEIDKLAAGLADHPHVVVLSDEIYCRIIYDGREHASLLAYPEIADRVILLDGWSKTFEMTGLASRPTRCGRRASRSTRPARHHCHSCVNAPTQFAGIAALEGPQDAVGEMVVAFDERRSGIVDGLNALPGVSCRTPGGAFYTFPNVTGTGLDAAPSRTVCSKGGGGHGGGHELRGPRRGVRPLLVREQHENIRRALDRSAKARREQRPRGLIGRDTCSRRRAEASNTGPAAPARAGRGRESRSGAGEEAGRVVRPLRRNGGEHHHQPGGQRSTNRSPKAPSTHAKSGAPRTLAVKTGS